VLGLCIYLSSELKQFVAPPSLSVREYYGEKVHSSGFMSSPVNGSWTVLFTVKPHFWFRMGKGDGVGAVLSDPELYLHCY